MDSFVKTQGYGTLTLDTGLDLAALSASGLQILYQKPDGTLGTWSASITATTKLVHTFGNSELDQVGVWKAQTACTIGGKNAYGSIYVFEVTERLS